MMLLLLEGLASLGPQPGAFEKLSATRRTLAAHVRHRLTATVGSIECIHLQTSCSA